MVLAVSRVGHVLMISMAMALMLIVAPMTMAVVGLRWPSAGPHCWPSAGLHASPRLGVSRCHALRLGLFDGVQSAVEGVQSTVEGVKAAYDDPNFVPDGFVRAHHILFLDSDDAEQRADVVKRRVEDGGFTFFEAAIAFSACPTRDLEGNLGTFTSLSRLSEGTLRGGSLPYDGKDTTAFDELVLAPDTALNTIHKVRSQWGIHLVLVLARGGQPDLIEQAAEQLVAKVAKASREPSTEPTAETAGFATRGGAKKKSKKRKKK